MQHAPTQPDVYGSLSDAVGDAVGRTVAIGGLGGIALIHALQAPSAFAETSYLGVLFIGAIVASVTLAVVLTRTSDQRAWRAAGGLAALILVGYVVSRTVGLPSATNDVGEWTEPLGLASMVVEGLLVCLTVGVLATQHATGAVVSLFITTSEPQTHRAQAGGVAPLG